MKSQRNLNHSGNSHIKLILLFAALTAAIFLVFFAIRFVNEKKVSPPPAEKNPSTAAVPTSTKDLFVLPPSHEGDGSASGTAEQSAEAAEKYFPGDFYKAPDAPVDFTAAYSLPLNIKTDAANYYDFSRKINLDESLADLNSSGFAIIDNPFSAAENFYEAYRELNSRQIPPFVTADFIAYYYQNITKLAFKKIESAVFYDALWQTNKKLYESAKERYEKKYSSGTLINDISLEAARRELAFLAVSLSLLQPAKDQVGGGSGLGGDGKFSSSEAEEFSFHLPEYLKSDVSLELSLIRAAGTAAKSPVLLYERDYQNFSIPAEYQANERLKNFYLASLWLSSVWPLYPKSVDCPNCFLDKEDWRVSLYAALLLSDDLASSQDLKNQWAQIYKIKSFFSGLRSDLSYLHYRAALDKVFGADKKAADSLSGENLNINLVSLAEEIAKIDLPLIEGGRDKKNLAEKPYIGLKMLAEAYWPSEYIFANLTATSAGAYRGSLKEAGKISTACVDKGKNTANRCLPLAGDIINLASDQAVSGAHYASNTDYEFYSSRFAGLKKELANFTDASWHSNIFWLTLDVVKKNFSVADSVKPTFARAPAFSQKFWAQSFWINSQLPPDAFVFYESKPSRLGDEEAENDLVSYGFIEPNQILAGELLSNTKMIIDFLTALKIGEQGGAALYDLKKLEENLALIKAIIDKEAKSENLSAEDYKFIANLYREFAVGKKGAKILEIKSAGGDQKMLEKLDGIKFLLAIYARGTEKIIVAGPIFNYQEGRVGK
jgi:hypothetical protein